MPSMRDVLQNACAVSLLFFSEAAHAASSLDIHGMLSQTYVHTTQHDFLLPNSSEGSWEYTEMNLNVQQQFETIGYGAQLLVRDFGDEGNFDPVLDWAYLDYRPVDAFGIKVGKIKLPVGLYNEYRDVDHAKTEILFPQIFNPEDYRAAAHAYVGAGLHGSIELGDQDLLQYHFWYGTNFIRDDFFLVTRTREDFEQVTTLDQESMTQDSELLTGGQLVWNMDRLGLKLGFTSIYYKGSFDVRFPNLLTGQIMNEPESINLKITWNVISIDWFRGPWNVSSEFMLRDNDYTFGRKFREAFFIPASITDPVADGDYTRSWYLTGRYQWNDRWGSFLSFGVMEVDLHHATTTNALGQTVDRPDSQRELSSGFRWDITQHLTFKLQGSRFWGHHGTLDAKTNDAQHWMLWMGRLTVTF